MKRKIIETLAKRLKSDRAIALLGPRQAGKSFLLQELIRKAF